MKYGLRGSMGIQLLYAIIIRILKFLSGSKLRKLGRATLNYGATRVALYKKQLPVPKKKIDYQSLCTTPQTTNTSFSVNTVDEANHRSYRPNAGLPGFKPFARCGVWSQIIRLLRIQGLVYYFDVAHAALVPGDLGGRARTPRSDALKHLLKY